MRVAVFFTPPPDHPLTDAASRWLARDAFSGDAVDRGMVEGISPAEVDALTAEPRRYGFHATLKPPFRIAAGHDLGDVETALAAFGATARPVLIPALRIEKIGSFFALTPAEPVPALDALAADTVRAFDGFRAPAPADEVARRRPDRLTERQREQLERWGYPYVFKDFRFHMTLTGGVPAERQATVAKALVARFGRFVGMPLVIDSLALFLEPHPPSDFVVRTRLPLSNASELAETQ